jgi:hypothetical protein
LLKATQHARQAPAAGPGRLAGLVSGTEMPVLRQTARRLDEARQNIDRVSGRDITDIVLQDPLLAIRVLAYIQASASRRLQSDITNIASAVMMLGVDPFFRQFDQPLTSRACSAAAAGPARRAAGDPAHATRVALRPRVGVRAARHERRGSGSRGAAARPRRDPAVVLCARSGDRDSLAAAGRRSLRSASVQQEVLGFPLAELQLALCHAWQLPELLTTLMDDGNAHLPRVQNVKLAVNLARHSIDGWADPAIPDDLKAVQDLLHISRETLLHRLQLPPELLPRFLREGAAGV